jgi:hypothetical protein
VLACSSAFSRAFSYDMSRIAKIMTVAISAMDKPRDERKLHDQAQVSKQSNIPCSFGSGLGPVMGSEQLY